MIANNNNPSNNTNHTSMNPNNLNRSSNIRSSSSNNPSSLSNSSNNNNSNNQHNNHHHHNNNSNSKRSRTQYSQEEEKVNQHDARNNINNNNSNNNSNANNIINNDNQRNIRPRHGDSVRSNNTTLNNSSNNSNKVTNKVNTNNSINPSNTSTSTSSPSPAAISQSSLSFHHEDLHCVICQDYPPTEIYQCINGHLLCAADFKKLVDGHGAKCPCCRTHLNRERPTRNRFAELVLAQLLMPCTNTGCNEQVKFSEMNTHLKNDCGMRKANCKYYLFNCDWSGLAKDIELHHSNCLSHVSEGILDAVKIRNEQIQAENKKTHQLTTTQAYVTKMLQKRARDISLRDVIIERCSLTDLMVTKIFEAIGIHWEVYIDPMKPRTDPITNQEITEVRMHLKVISKLKRRTTVEIFVLAGPTLDVGEFSPALRRVLFKPHVKESESFPLNFNNEQSKTIYARDSVHFRMGFLDVSRGSVKHGFSTVNGPEIDELEDSASDTTVDSIQHNNNRSNSNSNRGSTRNHNNHHGSSHSGSHNNDNHHSRNNNNSNNHRHTHSEVEVASSDGSSRSEDSEELEDFLNNQIWEDDESYTTDNSANDEDTADPDVEFEDDNRELAEAIEEVTPVDSQIEQDMAIAQALADSNDGFDSAQEE